MEVKNMTTKLLTIAELYKVRAKLKQLKDFCSEEVKTFNWDNEQKNNEHYPDEDYLVCQGRAELAESILELIGDNDNG